MQRWFARTLSLALLAVLSSSAFAQYTLTNLVSNQIGQATHQDPLLINGWGLAYGPSTAFWVSDEGSGWSTLYDGSGNPQSLQVIVPPAKIGTGSPTGIVYNGSQEFQIDTWPSEFMFATLDGTIQGWSHFSPGASIIAVNNSKTGASYTGLAVTSKSSGNLIYAANLNGKIEVYNSTFQLVNSFTDPTIPSGWAPFGIQDIDKNVLVSFAPVNGSNGGQVDVFTESGTLTARLKNSALNQPWGFALAPSNFGKFSNTLLVSNNTNSGTINAFNTKTGKFMGTISDSTGKAITIDQLWGIEFGGGTSLNGQKNQLFFTAGPNNNVDGTFGVINLQ